MWEPPRPLMPHTATLIRSLAPIISPEALVPLLLVTKDALRLTIVQNCADVDEITVVDNVDFRPLSRLTALGGLLLDELSRRLGSVPCRFG